MSIRFTILLAITTLQAAGCCCLPPPACFAPCAPLVCRPAAVCAPVGVRQASMVAQAPHVPSIAMQQPIAGMSGLTTRQQPMQSAGSLPTMPRRQVIRDKVKLPQIPRPKWPITKQYSQSLDDFSLATATSTRSGSQRCNCDHCRRQRHTSSCQNCGYRSECDSCDNWSSLVCDMERSCAAPMSVYGECSCAAPMMMSTDDGVLGLAVNDCENCRATHQSGMPQSSSASGNAYVPPPAPVMAPPAIDEPGLLIHGDAEGRPIDVSDEQPEVYSAPVPLPEVAPELTSVDAFKSSPHTNATLEKQSILQPAIMPIIDLMGLQVPAGRQVLANATVSEKNTDLEAETITLQATAITRKRVQ